MRNDPLRWRPSLICLLLAAAAAGAPGDLPRASLFLDADWYRARLIEAADLWNGGLDGRTGMGAYRDDFNGCFHVELDRQWRPGRMRYTTAVAQSRVIYMNVGGLPGRGSRGGGEVPGGLEQRRGFPVNAVQGS